MLLFRGTALPLHHALLKGNIKAHICPSILNEYIQVLSYRKFGLTKEETSYLIDEEILPFFIIHDEPPQSKNWIVEDSSDNKFIDLACTIPGSILVSGDIHLLQHRDTLPCRTISLAECIDMLSSSLNSRT